MRAAWVCRVTSGSCSETLELKSRVLPINAAVSGEDGFVELGCEAPVDSATGIYCPLLREIERRGVNLDSFKMRALKMDCEWCKHEAVLNTDPGDLAVFSQVIIEYHNGYHEIKKHLEAAGFSTETKHKERGGPGREAGLRGGKKEVTCLQLSL
jgi:hypothetical protein